MSIVLVLAILLPVFHIDALAEDDNSASESFMAGVPGQKDEGQGNEDDNIVDVAESEADENEEGGEVKEDGEAK